MKKANTVTLLAYLRKTAAFVFLIALLAITADVLRFVTIIVASPSIGVAGTAGDRPYEREVPEADMRILIAGDSTAVGVGAYTPKETIAGMFASDFPDIAIKNIAVSGARVSDVVDQLESVEGWYDMALVQVGANDIVLFSNGREVRENTARMMDSALLRSDTVIVVAPFDVGIVPLIPRFTVPLFSMRSADILSTMRDIVEEKGGIFIDLYKSDEEKQFASDTDTFFSADSFHPSSDGYALAYERIKRELCEREIVCVE
ncbi:MAG: hypothetical protein H8D63_01690 [Parcubacteria group bacterium]|nr:hypothetical protein [Parcubacteria group bacterium]